MPLQVKDGATWKEPSQLWVKDGGVWKEAKEGYVKDGGAWKKIWPNTPPSPSTVEYLIVAGGGGGCNMLYPEYKNPPGAGAGGYVAGTMSINAGTSYPVVIGAGGANGEGKITPEGAGGVAYGGARGANSSFNGVVARGGVPAIMSSWNSSFTELYKNSGYGCGAGADVEGASQGRGEGWPATDQGFGGGPFASGVGGGGGGAGGRGIGATNNTIHATADQTNGGGPGKQWVDGNYYAGGGGGSCWQYGVSCPGGIGGGGNGGINSTPGGANTGGGGGSAGGYFDSNGSKYSNSQPGGSGVVILRYPDTFPVATAHPGATHSQSGGYHYYKFTGAGSITF